MAPVIPIRTMSPAAPLILAAFLVCCGPLVGGFVICGFESTVMVLSASQDFLVTEENPGWSLQMNVTWPIADHGNDGYYIKAGPMGTLPSLFGCAPGDGYEFTPRPWYLFSDVSFGYKYEIRIKLYNTTTGQSSLNPAKFYTTSPDCYETTGSIEFCVQQPIGAATKIREPSIESVQTNQWGNGTDVGVSWLPPVQINGELRKIVLSYRPSEQTSYEGIEKYSMTDVDWDGDRNQRFSTILPSLQTNMSYILNMKALVQVDDIPYYGEEVEISFNTSTLIASDVTNHQSTTPKYVTTSSQYQTTVPTDTSGFNSFVAFIEEGWHWILLSVAVIVILLIATISMAIYCNRRKDNKQTVTIVP